MSSNLFGSGGPYMGRTADDIKADQRRAMAEDAGKERTAAAVRDRRAIGVTRKRLNEDEF
jgi:hypothetical protein